MLTVWAFLILKLQIFGKFYSQVTCSITWKIEFPATI